MTQKITCLLNNIPNRHSSKKNNLGDIAPQSLFPLLLWDRATLMPGLNFKALNTSNIKRNWLNII